MCGRCGWKLMMCEIEDMMGESRYDFARETLEGIYDWVSENHHITLKQIMAVQKIKGSVKEWSEK